MKCVIPGLNVKILGRAIHSMARIGDELSIEWKDNGLELRTMSSAEAAYSRVFFSRPFFTSYTAPPAGAACKVSMRAMLGVFKSPAHIDKQVEVCELKADGAGCKLVVTLRCKHSVVKTHSLSILDDCHVSALYSEDMLPNRLSTQHRVLSDAVSNFHPSEDKVSIQVTPQSLIIRNYTDSSDTSKIIRTQLSLKPEEFDHYSIVVDTNITFAMKEFRATLSFAEAVNLPISLRFEITGKPVIFTVNNNSTFEADFIMATEPPDSVTQQTNSTTQVRRYSSAKKRTSDVTQDVSRVAKVPHLEDKDPMDEDSHLFNFIEMPDESRTDAPRVNDKEEPIVIPGSPLGKVRTVFKRCFDATILPTHHAILARDSDTED